MAVRAVTVTPSPGGNANAALVTWTGLLQTSSDTGEPYEAGDFADATVQFGGTFTGGGTVVLEGSNDGVTYTTMTDPQGNNLQYTAAGLELIAEKPRYIRPRITAGGASTSISVLLYVRRTR